MVVLKRLANAVPEWRSHSCAHPRIGRQSRWKKRRPHRAECGRAASGHPLALASGGVQPSQVGYVEAHGTRTPLATRLKSVRSGPCSARDRSPEKPLMIGSAKTNMGHLEAASGRVG